MTACPSCTRMARTTPVSNGCTTLVRPLGTIFPVADATMSMVPNEAQMSAAQNMRPMVPAIMRPSGDGGVSMISSAAGRNASSSPRRAGPRRIGIRCRIGALADFMDACLQPVQRCIAAACLDQGVVGAVLDQTAPIEGDDAVREPHGREPVGDDEDGAPLCDLVHVLLNDPLALVIEGAGRLVEDENARIGDESAGDGDALALAAR